MNIKKLISIFLVIVLLMGIFSGCGSDCPAEISGESIVPESAPSTEPTASQSPKPTTPVISTEDRLLALDALKNYGEGYYQEFYQGRYRYLGTYDGCIVLFFNNMLTIGSMSDLIYVIDDGQVYHFKTYYPDSDLTETQVDQIYEAYEAALEADSANY